MSYLTFLSSFFFSFRSNSKMSENALLFQNRSGHTCVVHLYSLPAQQCGQTKLLITFANVRMMLQRFSLLPRALYRSSSSLLLRPAPTPPPPLFFGRSVVLPPLHALTLRCETSQPQPRLLGSLAWRSRRRVASLSSTSPRGPIHHAAECTRCKQDVQCEY